jgi:hypothetical protein
MKKSSLNEELIWSQFLAPANFLLRLSGRAYEKYMANKIYLHALNIRKANEMVYQLVLENISCIPEKLQADCVEMLNHYDGWMLQFKDEEQKRKPALTDEFIFQRADGQMAYPRQAEQNILNSYLKFTKQKNK